MYGQNEINEVLKHMVDAGVCELSVDENGEFTFFMNDEQKDACDKRRAEGKNLMGDEDDG